MEPDMRIDVDHHDPEFLASRHDRYAEIRRQCPVAFNERYGGFWLVTDHESVATVARDNETFAHRYEPDPDPDDDLVFHGICGIPRVARAPRQGVSEIDGPEHADVRRLLNPFFTPARVEALRPRMVEVSTWFLDQVVGAGSCDLVLDYTTPVPGVLTLEMMGLPSSNWRHYADFFHATVAYEPDRAEFQEAVGRRHEMVEELLGFADHRRSNPADDITTALVTGHVLGEPLDDTRILDIMWNLVAGGLDTTTSLVSWALHHLGTHPDDRRRLIDQSELIPTAIEEFLRFYSPSETLTRTATCDVELGGSNIRRGDVVMIAWVAANRDECVFDLPDEVVVDREPNRHLAFGLGGHRCIGSHVARVEAELMLADVLERLPDYELDLAAFRPYPYNALMTGVVSMPASFSPGPTVGPTVAPF
ncbi:MAG: cytochrome P450 [Acidimicrobiales bacterium]|nr:cytochrome P450 [Actinomycetes bacterium]MDP6104744.1 cytochrome P450 [Acidimicrobiales bacterium]MDP6239689.1 cytochrome P450 [Acidimicrobiales bacterium]MDP6760933.1 cytochrome P450 [Acidimicrobiales bacterium]MDP7124387.1 cytochrome P450 [Acidimicrobiales bacterium]